MSDFQKRKALAQLVRACLLRKNILKTGVSALALGAIAISPNAFAQNEQGASNKDPNELQEVLVTGIRSSIESSQEIKKNADVFVDSITAEDIGALPDRSVTEALQRIPGVSISRFAGANDPDHFSIEGSGVVVRGLNQVRSELNGRDTFSANSGRFLSFSDVPPELLYGVDVFKNQSADMIEGGLAGSVNLRTRVPFDSDGQLWGGSLEANYGDFAETFSPTGSLLYSNRWELGSGGEVGLLANIVYSKLESRSDGVQASSFVPNTTILPGNTVYFPEGAAFRSQDYERERTGGAMAAQWKNSADTAVATFQFMRSEATTAWGEHAMEIATDVVGGNGPAFLVGTDYGFNSDNVFTHGTVSAPTGWRTDQQDCDGTLPNDPNPQPNGCNNDYRTPIYGLQSNNIFRTVEQEYMTQDMGLNFKWTPNDNWAYNFDLQFVDSTVSNLDNTIWGASFQNALVDLRGGIPQVQFLPASQNGTVVQCPTPGGGCPTYFNGTHNSYQDPFNSFWRAAMDHAEDSDGQEIAAKFDIEYNFTDHAWLKGMKFGARGSQRDQTTRSTTYNWGALSEIWGNNGPVWMNDPVNGVPDTRVGTAGTPSATQTALYTFDNFMRGKAPIPSVVPFYNGSTVGSGYEETAAFAESIRNEWVGPPPAVGNGGGWVRLSDPHRAPAGVALTGPGGRYLPQEINHTVEDVKSAYFMLKFGNDEMGEGQSLSGNIGVRYVETDFEANGTTSAPLPSSVLSEAQCAAQMTSTGICLLPLAERERLRRFSTGIATPTQANTSYKNWLPSFNLKIGMTDEMLIRLGFSKAMARPDLGLMRMFYNVVPVNTGGLFRGFTVQTGNPYLKPTVSTQYDLSYEWYFDEAGSLTLSGFHKTLDDVLTNSTSYDPVTSGGETYIVENPTAVNSKVKGSLHGFELAYQQFYDMLPGWASGFGIQANYTRIDSTGVPQTVLNPGGTGGVTNQANIDTSRLPLQGLSKHNANFALIYEKGPISTRVAYNYRSEYVVTVRDVITPFAPIVQEATGQMDASFFYSINDNLKVGIQGVNLLDEVTKTSQIINNDLVQAGRSWFINDRRISLGVRASF